MATNGVIVRQGGAPVLFYRSHPEIGRETWRMDYLHPVFTVQGTVLTEDAPADHTHQRGIFWAWRRILVDGEVVADSWVGRQFELQGEPPELVAHPDGSTTIRGKLRWLVPVAGMATEIVEESSEITVFPLDAGARRIVIDVRLKALQPGVALAGSDDEKGYGGLSFRFRDAPAMTIHSDTRELRATLARMQTGPEVDFTWAPSSALSAAAVKVECRVDGRPWTQWVLRQEPSMQNCAFPGRSPYELSTDRVLHLAASLTLQ